MSLSGLIAATHTPFDDAGDLNLRAVEAQAEYLNRNKVHSAFVGGSTGEAVSLTLDERLRLTKRWSEVIKGTSFKLVVHVGSNCLPDARELAFQAEKAGAAAIATIAPSYFKPTTVESLVEWCAAIAAAAPNTPFYFYDIPVLTGVRLDMPEFLEKSVAAIPTMAGLKFTNTDLMALQLCRAAAGGRFNVLFGYDEMLLSAMVLGVKGAVGSTYNLAAPMYHRLIAAFERGELETARAEQLRSAQLVAILNRRGFIPSTKVMMKWLGVDVGLARLPFQNLTPLETDEFRKELAICGFLPR